jgi:hypothetical protein
MPQSDGQDARFEESYRKHEFSELVRLTICAAAAVAEWCSHRGGQKMHGCRSDGAPTEHDPEGGLP